MATSTASCVFLLGLGLAPMLAAAPDAVADDKIGVNSAVNPDADGTPPRAPTRRLELGQEIVHDEHVETGPQGQTQILFLDASSMTVGPNSDLTIDNFVYDPNAGTGQLAMSATKGVMRFVGGKISKNDNAVTMNTPTATLGIRGGVFLLNLAPNGKMEAVFLYGKGLTVTANGQTQTITHPGWSVSVGGVNLAPSKPAPAPASNVANIIGQLTGHVGSTGGSAKPPVDAGVAGSGVSNAISGNVAASTQQAASNNTAPPTRPPETNVGTVQTTLQVNTAAVQPVLVSVAGTSSPTGSSSSTASTTAIVTPTMSPTTTTTTMPTTTTAAPQQTTGATTPMQAPAVNFPTSGVGSYTGTASGTVLNNGATYQATGGFSQTYNFASQTGVASITNFDSANYSFGVNGNGPNFTGTLSSGPTNRTGSLSGSFTGTGATQTGGNFGIQSTAGPTYQVNGTFTGH